MLNAAEGRPAVPANAAPPAVESRYAIPETRPDHIRRPRLLKKLDQGVERPLTLASAPAGTGKTVLFASWAASCKWPLAWQTLDDGDRRPGIFWSRFLTALGHAGADVADLGLPRSLDSLDLVLLERLGSRLAERREPIVFVLDDGDSPPVAERDRALTRLLRGSHGSLRLMMLERADPLMPLQRYQLDGDLTNIRANELALNDAETLALIRQSGVRITGGQAARLRERTGGWVATVRFAAMSLAGQDDVAWAIDHFTGTDINVAAYLVSEVLETQPPEIRELLLRTSMADVLTPELVELLAGKAQGPRVMDFLAQGNPFIEVRASGGRNHYRYQPLFGEFLRARLAFENPELAEELRRSVATFVADDVPVADPREETADASPADAATAGRPLSLLRARPRTGPEQRSEPVPARPRLSSVKAPSGLVMSADGVLIESLTPKEQEVLEHLAELLSTSEIAKSMCVSVNTVRTHVRTMLRKLGASRRNEAVRRAWDLGLLPQPGESPMEAG